jgi:hypothetical protein
LTEDRRAQRRPALGSAAIGSHDQHQRVVLDAAATQAARRIRAFDEPELARLIVRYSPEAMGFSPAITV